MVRRAIDDNVDVGQITNLSIVAEALGTAELLLRSVDVTGVDVAESNNIAKALRVTGVAPAHVAAANQGDLRTLVGRRLACQRAANLALQEPARQRRHRDAGCRGLKK